MKLFPMKRPRQGPEEVNVCNISQSWRDRAEINQAKAFVGEQWAYNRTQTYKGGIQEVEAGVGDLGGV